MERGCKEDECLMLLGKKKERKRMIDKKTMTLHTPHYTHPPIHTGLANSAPNSSRKSC